MVVVVVINVTKPTHILPLTHIHPSITPRAPNWTRSNGWLSATNLQTHNSYQRQQQRYGAARRGIRVLSLQTAAETFQRLLLYTHFYAWLMANIFFTRWHAAAAQEISRRRRSCNKNYKLNLFVRNVQRVLVVCHTRPEKCRRENVKCRKKKQSSSHQFSPLTPIRVTCYRTHRRKERIFGSATRVITFWMGKS